MGVVIQLAKSIKPEENKVSYMIRYTIDDSNCNYTSLDEFLSHDEREKAYVKAGGKEDTVWVSKDDIVSGKVEIDGKLAIGAKVRVLKEGAGDNARVAYIKVLK